MRNRSMNGKKQSAIHPQLTQTDNVQQLLLPQCETPLSKYYVIIKIQLTF